MDFWYKEFPHLEEKFLHGFEVLESGKRNFGPVHFFPSQNEQKFPTERHEKFPPIGKLYVKKVSEISTHLKRPDMALRFFRPSMEKSFKVSKGRFSFHSIHELH